MLKGRSRLGGVYFDVFFMFILGVPPIYGASVCCFYMIGLCSSCPGTMFFNKILPLKKLKIAINGKLVPCEMR